MILTFNSAVKIVPASASILVLLGLFKEKSDTLEAIIDNCHFEIIDRVAKELDIPWFITGDTKFLRSLLQLGSGGHLKGKCGVIIMKCPKKYVKDILFT